MRKLHTRRALPALLALALCLTLLPVPAKAAEGILVGEGKTVSRPPLDAPRGYAFEGWHADAACTRPYDFASPVTADLTLRTERMPFFWEDYGGDLSENPRMTWSLDASDCAFTLSGEGGTGSYECDPVWPGTFPDWYGHRLKIRTIEVREGADSIGKNTFSGCCGAVRASLPEGLESVGEYAFSGCGRLEEIALPDTLTAVGSHAFDGCARLRTIVIPESVKTIGERAFEFSSVQNGPVHVFYAGTREQWEDVEPDNGLEGAALHYECPEAGTLYPVTFDSRGGSPVEAQLRLPGELPEEPEAPEREGYTFAGWYRDGGCTEPWDFARDRVDGETALYAGWDPVPRTVRFSGGGDQTVSHGQRAEEPAAPVRAGAPVQRLVYR